MKNLIIIITSIFIGIYSRAVAGDQIDTLAANESISHYEFNLSLKAQEGYGIIFGLHSATSGNQTVRNIAELGLTSTISGHGDGIGQTFVSVETNYISDKTVYGLVAGADIKEFLDVGLSLNYMTNFSDRALFIRPRFGFWFIPIGIDSFASIEWDVRLLKPNFKMPKQFLVSLRYDLGLFKRNR
jgi:hypothetical protein